MHILAARPEFIWFNGDDGQPAGVQAPGRFGHEGDARKIAQRLVIVFEDLPLAPHPVFQHPQLPTADGGEDVAHAVVVADLGVLVVGGRIAGLPPGPQSRGSNTRGGTVPPKVGGLEGRDEAGIVEIKLQACR